MQEVSKLKSLLDVAAASTTGLGSGNWKSSNKSGDDNEDEDDMEDVSFIREEVATQKEIIIARDQVCIFILILHLNLMIPMIFKIIC